ncbi:AraC family transcriptional regulator [Paenibacillus periandrae]|uniref:AraC family transcriptional regulator n=1 Tax=Paenibacillus periandrae TaxID=1761741 RepID=UPI001F09F817|nr:AraC family transcriptional regulator [Paenibacillus periandrae]
MLSIHSPTNLALEKNGIYVRSEVDNFQESWPIHTHHGTEIYFFIQGDATLLIGDVIYSPSPGDMFIFNGSVLHRINPSKETPYVRSYVNFNELFIQDVLTGEMIDKLSSLFQFPNGLLVRWDPEECEQIKELFIALRDEDEKESVGFKVMMKTYLVQMLFKIYRKTKQLYSFHTVPTHSQKQSSVRRVLHFINQNYTETFSLDELSKVLHLNKYYICHSFKEATGYTVNNYLIRKRIEEAKKMLLSTDRSVLDISEKLGFNTPVYFSRAFKQYVGISPQSYRRHSDLG